MCKRESLLRLNIEEMKDDKLLSEFMDWFRIYRNEQTLPEDERKHFKALCSEIRKRKLLSPKELYREK